MRMFESQEHNGERGRTLLRSPKSLCLVQKSDLRVASLVCIRVEQV
jgi:hypothetical protein